MRCVLITVGATMLAAFPALASASVHFTSQSNVAVISFTQSDFSDARVTGANTLASVADAPGDSIGLGWSSDHNTSQEVSATGGVTVTLSNPGTMPYYYFVSHPTGTPGAHTYSYVRTQPDGPAFVATTLDGLPVLHLEVTSSPVVPAGSDFRWSATIPGDWSSVGAGPGQAELVALNGGWTVSQNFVYDGSVTHIEFERIPGGANGPGAVLRFHGVPSPGGVMLLAGAVVGLGKRRRVGRPVRQAF